MSDRREDGSARATDALPVGGVVAATDRGAEVLARARAEGVGVRTELVVDQPHQRVLLLGLPAGGGLPEHDAPPAATLQCLSGEVVLVAAERRWVLPAGSLVPVPQEQHRVDAVVDSICLLAVCTG